MVVLPQNPSTGNVPRLLFHSEHFRSVSQKAGGRPLLCDQRAGDVVMLPGATCPLTTRAVRPQFHTKYLGTEGPEFYSAVRAWRTFGQKHIKQQL